MSRYARQYRAIFWLAGGLLLPGPGLWPAPGQIAGGGFSSLRGGIDSRSRVVITHNDNATRLFIPQPSRIDGLVRCGLTNLTGQPTETAAWQSLLATQEILGIKVFSSPGPTVGTRLPVVSTIVAGLLRAGHPPHQIIVWDKHLSDLREAGYLELRQQFGVRVEGAAEAGYDEEVVYENPLLGQLVYGDYEFGKTDPGVGRKSFVSRLVTKEITKLMLVSPLLNHHQAGVCGNLFSLSMGSMDNTLRFEPNGERLAQAVPEIFALPELGDRVVLCWIDALICQYQGQERGLLHYASMLNEIWVGRDPVALDVLCLDTLKRQREQAGITTGFLNRPLYENASLLEIGTSDLNRIYVERFSVPPP